MAWNAQGIQHGALSDVHGKYGCDDYGEGGLEEGATSGNPRCMDCRLKLAAWMNGLVERHVIEFYAA
jgi:hypothetical protein